MVLAERVRIARRFLRSVRIDSDLGNASALEGFVCPESSAEVLLTMARHVAETRHGAFTWTGPYGSGKSSLAVALGALLNGNARLRQEASTVFDGNVVQTIWKALPTGSKGVASASCRRPARRPCESDRRSRANGRARNPQALRRLDGEQLDRGPDSRSHKEAWNARRGDSVPR